MLGALADLVRVFGVLSLLSVGGGSVIIAEMQRQVIAHHWATPKQFLDFYAIARASPGPGMQLVTLVGWQAAGWAGAIVASLAMFLPSGLLVYFVATAWGRLPETRGKQAVVSGLAPLSVGLTFASALTLLSSSDHPVIATVTAIACAAVLRTTTLNPLAPLAIAGAMYLIIGTPA